MSLADEIRAWVFHTILDPAFQRGEPEVTVRSGDVHRDMGLVQRMPAVCSALEARKFQTRFGVCIADRQGPPQGASVLYVFRPVGTHPPGGRPGSDPPPRQTSDKLPGARAGRRYGQVNELAKRLGSGSGRPRPDASSVIEPGDLMRELGQREQSLSSQLRHPAMTGSTINGINESVMKYDFFICHASEDKESFVRELATLLKQKGAEIWYDEFALRIGDSLRREIDKGLANSKFGIVILSRYFFEKEWPQKELDGLDTLAIQGQSRILPIWHNVSKDAVEKYSPTLADTIALDTSSKSTADIAKSLMDLIQDR